MLRWLMAWCVPERSLRFHSNLDECPFDRDSANGESLWVALASHGLGRFEAEPGA
jgi:hypothetical protein